MTATETKPSAPSAAHSPHGAPSVTEPAPKRGRKAASTGDLAADEAKRREKMRMRAVKLRELSERRIPRAVKMIRQIGNLAAYAPTPEQTAAIISEVTEAVDQMRLRLRGGTQSKLSFRLPE